MKLKRLFVSTVALEIALLTAACSSANANNSKNGYVPKQLNVEFVPSSQANKIEAKAKPLEGLLEKQLQIPVHVTVSTSNNGLIEAMASKKVDAGFMPPDTYVLAHKRKVADVLLQAERYGYDEPSGKVNNKLMSKYRGAVYVKKNSGIKSWKDLKGKKIAVGDPISSSGYVYPIVDLYKKGLNVLKDCKIVQIEGTDQAIIAVENGDVDACFGFTDARPIAAQDDAKIMKNVIPIYFTNWIPNDTISVRHDMNKKFRSKLARAFKNVAKSKKGKKILESIYAHYGYVNAKDSDFNIMRTYQNEISKIQK